MKYTTTYVPLTNLKVCSCKFKNKPHAELWSIDHSAYITSFEDSEDVNDYLVYDRRNFLIWGFSVTPFLESNSCACRVGDTVNFLCYI